MEAEPARKKRRISPDVGDFKPLVVSSFEANASKWNLEQDYETKPRVNKKKDKENGRLPIKTADGRIEKLHVPVAEVVDAEQVETDSDATLQAVAEEVKPQIPVKQQILEAKEELARIASLINENPEEHVGGLRALSQFSASKNITIKKLALATQLAVFKDIIPGYRIRPIGENDMTEKISKDVRKLRAFEQGLVASYQAYVKTLSKCAGLAASGTSDALISLGTVAISCACALLLAVPHFNFRGDLVKILVDKLSSRKVDSNFSKCRETLESLFRDDEDGTASLDAVTMLCKMIKGKNYNINESVLNTFLHLRLLSEFSSKGSQNQIDKPEKEEFQGKQLKQKKVFRTKKERKLMKERKVVEKEFKEADAIVSHEERDRMQAESLKLVFVTYFRILKARSGNLMGAVLEGLAKYAHLINQDFFGDLLEALKELTAQAEALQIEVDGEDATEAELDAAAVRDSTREALLCIITAFALLEGQDAAKAATSLSLDLSFFTTHLYRSLHALALNPDIELSSKSLHLPDPTDGASQLPKNNTTKVNVKTTSVLLIRSLSSTLLPRQTPPVRVAAFTHQLISAALHMPERTSTAVLGIMNQVARMHGRKIAGMWNTEERKGDGEFDALLQEVEGSNPFAGTVWQGELLRLHYAESVRSGLKGLEGILKEIKV
jgi:nucleolar complex protein 3